VAACKTPLSMANQVNYRGALKPAACQPDTGFCCMWSRTGHIFYAGTGSNGEHACTATVLCIVLHFQGLLIP
jgi:hypothetical protein